jgi:hypothetical protein
VAADASLRGYRNAYLAVVFLAKWLRLESALNDYFASNFACSFKSWVRYVFTIQSCFELQVLVVDNKTTQVHI